ncbi:hypothetical protein A2U01_0006724 [Trifolium medium]|uniref:Uncharacterized protein n=1 Tax=Trifolium medium TaxID=97028 RepID=A0A392MEE5_9FABA|nr:hypothetical protein [Trifolium medium]
MRQVKDYFMINKGNTQVVWYSDDSDADWAGSPADGRSTSGHCFLIGGNLISWWSKKQNIGARNRELFPYWRKLEYCAMAIKSL